MDMGTLNILNNFRFVFGGGIELEEMIKQMLKEENIPSSVRREDNAESAYNPLELKLGNIPQGSPKQTTHQMKKQQVTLKTKPPLSTAQTTTKHDKVDQDSSMVRTSDQNSHQQGSLAISTNFNESTSTDLVIDEKHMTDRCPLCGCECSLTDMTHSQMPYVGISNTATHTLNPSSKNTMVPSNSIRRCHNCMLNRTAFNTSQISPSVPHSQKIGENDLHENYQQKQQPNKLYNPLDLYSSKSYNSKKRKMLETSEISETLLSVDGDVPTIKKTNPTHKTTIGVFDDIGLHECCIQEADFPLPKLRIFGNVCSEIGYLDIAEENNIRTELMKGQTCFVDLPPGKDVDAVRNEQEIFCEEKDSCPDNEGAMRQHTQMKVMKAVTQYFDNKITEIVRFAKFIPGFRNLPINDQATLVKESKIESDLLGGAEGLNMDSRVWSNSDNQHYTVEELKTLFPADLVDEPLRFVAKTRRLDLKIQERALLRAISITFTDRKELGCPEEVQTLHNKLVTCLLHVIQEYHPRPSVRIGQLVNLLVELRQTTDTNLQHYKNILLKLPEYSESHMLVTEFFQEEDN